MKTPQLLSLALVLLLLSAALAGCADSGRVESPAQETPAAPADSQPAQETRAPETPAPSESAPGQSIRTNGGEVIGLARLAHQDAAADAAVYYTSDIRPEAMVALYDALGVGLTGERIAVKLSTGEPPASNYLDPGLIAGLVHQVNGAIVENNTAYGGQRSSTAMHDQVAENHGFTGIADFVVLDEEGSVSLPVAGGRAADGEPRGRSFPGV